MTLTGSTTMGSLLGIWSFGANLAQLFLAELFLAELTCGANLAQLFFAELTCGANLLS